MWGWDWRGGNQSTGAEAWRWVCADECVLCERTWCKHACVGARGLWTYEEDAPGSTPASWACVLFPHLFIPPPPALKLPSSSLGAVSAGASKINITSFLVTSVLGSASQHSGWTRNEKDETQQEMLSVCHHTLLFTVRFLLSNGLSHPVTPCYTDLIQCVTVQTCIFFPIPCHCSWYIDIKCIVYCHKMSLPKAICQALNPAVSAESFSTLSPREVHLNRERNSSEHLHWSRQFCFIDMNMLLTI